MSMNAHIDWKPEYFADGYTEFKVGKGCFKDDIWDFNGLQNSCKNRSISGNQIKFTEIESPKIVSGKLSPP